MSPYKKPTFNELIESMEFRSDLKTFLNNIPDKILIVDPRVIEKVVIFRKFLQSPERVIFTLKDVSMDCGKTLIFVSKEGFYSTRRYD